MEWTKIEDEKPEVGESVLTYEDGFIEMDYYEELFEEPYPGGGEISTGFGFVHQENATHWMELPEPPKE